MTNKTKERIIQFVDLQYKSKRSFCEKISKSESYFTKDSAMGSDVLENISQLHPELNMDWVITGRGEMTYHVNQNHIDLDKEAKLILSEFIDQRINKSRLNFAKLIEEEFAKRDAKVKSTTVDAVQQKLKIYKPGEYEGDFTLNDQGK